VDLVFEAGAVDPGQVPVGCTVWKTDDPAMKRRLERTYAGDPIARRAPVWFELTGDLGGPVRLTARAADGLEASADWSGPLEEARKHPLSAAAVTEHLARLGDTPFELAGVELRLPAIAMLPKSVLNELRRQAIGRLVAAREAAGRVAVADPDALAKLRAEIGERRCVSTPMSAESTAGPSQGAARPAELAVLVRTIDQLDAVLPHRPAMVYCDFEDVRRYREAVPRARAAGVPVGLATLRVLKPGEEGFLKPVLQAEPDAVLVRNLAALLYFREQAPAIERVADFSLNVANELTADLLMREGFARLTPGYDLNWEQFAGLVRRSDPAWYEAVIHQHMPMFHMEHCVFAAFLSAGKDWRDCGRPCDRHAVELRDRVGAAFPVTPDAGCRNTVFNAVPQSGAEYVPQMRALGVRRFRVELLREAAGQVGPLLDAYRRVVAGADDGRDTWKRLRAMNQLGVTRGTLQLV
ncbi:MAG TPA: DUF3656 domain-containing protein, partial [Gemmataceae bacterium]|nr:DUF3656 domain-containing protein [Gemmataceae bacterium]